MLLTASGCSSRSFTSVTATEFADFLRTASMVLLAAWTACAAACVSNEPSDASIRQHFTAHRAGFDELLRQFEIDRKAGLSFVTAQGNHSCVRAGCLSGARIREYAAALRRVGVQEIHYGDGNRHGVYFQLYRESAPGRLWGAFRMRGIFYATGVVPRTLQYNDDTEERYDIGNGWYSYRILDD